MRSRSIAAAVVLLTLIGFAVQTAVVTRAGFFMGDFRAFYCGARVAAQRGDPYRTEPLRSCERAVGSIRFFEKNPGIAIPAPLPPYAIAALVPIALLPFSVAATLWISVLLLAWLACVTTLARVACVGWEIALAIFGLSLGAVSLPFGEVVPLVLGCLCVASYLTLRGRHRWAAVVASGAMIEPHLGLPACLALAIWQPAARMPLAIVGVTLALSSVAALGFVTNLEYFTSVLPAHAISEVGRDTQLSFTAILAHVGFSPALALKAGALEYVAMVALGVAVGGLLAKRTGNPVWLLCAPPAFAVFGGTFIHVTQIAVSLPAAVLLIVAAPRAQRSLAIVALLLLTVPWVWALSPALVVAPLVPVGYLTWRYWNEQLTPALVAALVTTALIIGLIALAAATPAGAAHRALVTIDPHLAEYPWSHFTQRSSTSSLSTWMMRLPTWIGLALLLGLLISRIELVSGYARIAAATAVVAIFTLLPIGAQFYADAVGGRLGIDLHAYYCAARAERLHLNPYLMQSLKPCERQAPPVFYRPPRNVTVPAPYPPYVFALFAPLTLLPLSVAAAIWWTMLGLALVLAATALARITALPWLVAWSTLALSGGLTSFSGGNLMPIALAALLLAALAVVRGKPLSAALAVGVAMIEPHVALPAAIALAVGYSRIRVWLSAVFITLAGLSLLSGGVARSIAYVTTVIPAHALSEVSRDNQYSLSTVIAALGIPDASAAVAGSLGYVVMTAIGIVAALQLARRFSQPAMMVLVPPAYALCGGSFLHVVEIAAAVPACLLLWSAAPAYRRWIFPALLLLCVPWLMSASVALFLAPAFPVAYLTYMLWSREPKYVLSAALISCATILSLFTIAALPWPHPTAVHAHPAIDPSLAENSWRAFVLGASTNRPAMWLVRLPTWIGLVALVLCALLAGVPAQRDAGRSPRMILPSVLR